MPLQAISRELNVRARARTLTLARSRSIFTRVISFGRANGSCLLEEWREPGGVRPTIAVHCGC